MSPKGVPYITGKLHHIGGQLADASARRGSNSQAQEEAEPQVSSASVEEKPVPQEEQAPAPAKQPKAKPRSLEVTKALLDRHGEFNRLHRDVKAKLGEHIASIPEEIAQLQRRADALCEAEAKVKELFENLERLEEPSQDDEDYPHKLADAFKTVENSRLELIMTNSKLDKTPGLGQSLGKHSGHAKSDSIIPELNSLSFKQLFKFGLFLTLPIAIAILAGGLLIAIAIIAALRLGI